MVVLDHVFAQGIEPPQAADALDKAIAGLPSDAPGLPFVKRGEQQIGEMMFVMRWQRESLPPVALDLTFDRSVPVLMVSVLGEEDAAVRQLSAQLEKSLAADIDAPDSLRAAAAHAPGDPALLVRAALAFAHRFDGQLFALIDAALRSPESGLRQSGAKAAALVKYPQLAAVLGHSLEREQEEDTARMLALALSKCRNAMDA